MPQSRSRADASFRLIFCSLLLAFAGLSFAFLTPPALASPPSGFSYQDVASGWVDAVGATFTSSGRMFVWERGGRVWSVDNGVKSATPFIDLSNEVGSWGDHGLLGFALHPNFKFNGYVYLLYVVDRDHLLNCDASMHDPRCSATTTDYGSATIGRITRYQANLPAGATDYSSATSVDPLSRRVMLGETADSGCPILAQSHGVGSLLFGDDGTLFATCGDGASDVVIDTGSASDTYWNQALTGTSPPIIRAAENVGAYRAQMVNSLSGKLIRIDPMTGDGVSTNPWYDPRAPRAARSRVWSLGLRDPLRIALVPGSGSHNPNDGAPGVLLIGDAGLKAWEEINVARLGGDNFGAPRFEGMDPHPGYSSAITVNRDAPNPLFGSGSCTQRYFSFQDLIGAYGSLPLPNPCNRSVNIPSAIPTHTHQPPEIDWSYATATTRWSNVTGQHFNVGTNGVTGSMFSGHASTGGVWYSGTDFPAEYRNTYFHADSATGWIRRFVLDANNRVQAVLPFDDAAGPVVQLATSPLDGGLYVVLANGGIKRVLYNAGNLPPIAVAAASRNYGAAPLAVQFDASGSRDPEALPLTYQWAFGDGTPVSTQANPSHTFAGRGGPSAYTVTLAATDQGGLVGTDAIRVSVDNTPPTAHIVTPADGTRYPLTGQTLFNLTAALSDAESASSQLACAWQTTLHHNDHVHAGPIDRSCVTTTTVDPLGCGSESFFYDIALTVTDPAGLSAYDEVMLRPNCAVSSSADAGPDRVVTDSNGDGVEGIVLDGSLSSDATHAILSYGWYDDGNLIASGVTPQVQLPLGHHVVRLDVVNSAGNLASDVTNVQVNAAGAPPVGSFARSRLVAAATVNGSGSTPPINQPLSANVGANVPPTVSLSAPANGAVFAYTVSSIALAANAGDTDGNVVRVDFYADGRLIGSDATAPYAMTWVGPPVGAHSLTAVAVDNGSASAVSLPVNIAINAAPTVTLTAPLPGASVSGPNIVVNYAITGPPVPEPQSNMLLASNALRQQGRWFAYKNAPRYLVGGDTQAIHADPTWFDYTTLLDKFAAYRINKVRIFIDSNDLRSVRRPYAYDSRTQRYDLDTWDSAYWTATKDFIDKALARNVIVEITMSSVYPGCTTVWNNAGPSGLDRPIQYNKANNSNHAFTSNANSNFLPEWFDPTYAETSSSGRKVFDYQKRLYDKVLAELGAYPNVYFEIHNEPYNCGSSVSLVTAYLRYWAAYLRANTTRPVSVEADDSGLSSTNYSNLWDDANATVLNTHMASVDPGEISADMHAAQMKHKLFETNESGVYDFYVRPSNWWLTPATQWALNGAGLNQMTKQMWGLFLSGSQLGWYNLHQNIAEWDRVGTRIKVLRDLVDTLANLGAMSPVDGSGNEYDSLVTAGPSGSNHQVLANPGSEYVVYFWGTSSETAVNMTLSPAGSYNYKFYDPRDGTLMSTGNVTSGGGATTIASPVEGSWSGNVGLALFVSNNAGRGYDHLRLLLDGVGVAIVNPTGSYTFTNVVQGGHTVVAQLEDAQNAVLANAGATATVSVTMLAPPINQPPSVNVGVDRALAVGQTLDLQATVLDDGFPSPPGAATLQWTSQSGPATPTWPLNDANQAHTHVVFPTAGTYVLRLTANDGQFARFDELTVAVTAPNVPPTVSLSAPANGAVFAYSVSSISLAANAADTDGNVVRVDFYADGGLIGSDATAPYAMTWVGPPVGAHSLTAVAVDNGSASAVSLPVNIAINAAPTVTLTAPLPGALMSGANITVNYTLVGSGYDHVRLLLDGVGVALANPMGSYTFINVAPGAHSLTAQLEDAQNAVLANAGATATVSVTMLQDNWWNAAWGARRELTFDTTGITEAQMNIPVLVKLTPANFDYTQVQANGADLRFIDADGVTVLSHEIATFNVGGESLIWVKVPRIDPNSTTASITMYWNNPTAPDGQNRSGVWSNTALVAAVLPGSRSVQIGTTATTFATIINAGAVLANACFITPATAFTGHFQYQTTDPATNAPTGSPDTPTDIPAGAAQTFVLSLQPTSAIDADVAFTFRCQDAASVAMLPGINTLWLVSSSFGAPDIVALAATAENDGIVHLDPGTGTGAFSIASINLGETGSIQVSADTNGAALPVSLALCRTDPVTGTCLDPAMPTTDALTLSVAGGATPTFSVFASASAVVNEDPAAHRIFVRFRDAAGVNRGSTSVAVERSQSR